MNFVALERPWAVIDEHVGVVVSQHVSSNDAESEAARRSDSRPGIGFIVVGLMPCCRFVRPAGEMRRESLRGVFDDPNCPKQDE